MALTYGSSTASARPACGWRGVVSSVISCTFMRARKATSSGGGAVSSGVRNNPSFRAPAPRLRRLVNTLNGMESTMPASTGVNHQNKVRFELPHEHAPNQPHQRVPPMPPNGGGPGRAVGAARFCWPQPTLTPSRLVTTKCVCQSISSGACNVEKMVSPTTPTWCAPGRRTRAGVPNQTPGQSAPAPSAA